MNRKKSKQVEAPPEMAGLNLTRQEWMSHAAELGCIICGGYAAIHHLRDSVGMGQRADDYRTVPLCPRHHQYGTFRDPAIHSHPAEFIERYGSEVELWLKTIELVKRKIQQERLW